MTHAVTEHFILNSKDEYNYPVLNQHVGHHNGQGIVTELCCPHILMEVSLIYICPKEENHFKYSPQ